MHEFVSTGWIDETAVTNLTHTPHEARSTAPHPTPPPAACPYPALAMVTLSTWLRRRILRSRLVGLQQRRQQGHISPVPIPRTTAEAGVQPALQGYGAGLRYFLGFLKPPRFSWLFCIVSVRMFPMSFRRNFARPNEVIGIVLRLGSWLG